ncbi:MAG: radical SAM protein [Tissierellia bacterium]|nr:radical SAM protein [Tissierellia bacterium]
MEGLLVGLNASFSHTNLAIRLLQAVARSPVDFLEFTINQEEALILEAILDRQPKYIFWSCYIWNMEKIRALSESLALIDPGLSQWLGGPEVSFDGQTFLEDMPWIQGVILGEGEVTFPKLLEALEGERSLREVPDLVYRERGRVHQTPFLNEKLPMDKMPRLDYQGEDLTHKILYYEGMRGCPYKCSYCLSSRDNQVRLRSTDLLKEDMGLLFRTGSRQIKFIDRTFNLDKARSLDILDFFIQEAPQGINIHFEVTLELLDPDIIHRLKKAPPGLFQIEAGIQTTSPQVLDHIHRKNDLKKAKEVMDSLDEAQKMHRHLDLIIGLPGETLDTFKKSFDDVYQLGPEKIQVGFLKLLRGTELRDRAPEFGIKYLNKAPYEVLRTDSLSGRDILFLKNFAHIIEDYYDDQVFKRTNGLLMALKGLRPSGLFWSLTEFLKEEDLVYAGRKGPRLFINYWAFIKNQVQDPEERAQVYEALKEDFYMAHNRYIGHVLDLDDQELPNRAIVDWLEDLGPQVQEAQGFSRRDISRNIRGIVLARQKKELLIVYKDHKYHCHFEREAKSS